MSGRREALLTGTTAVALGGRALLIEGEPGSGKTSLALALIDRGATLIGDDGVRIVRAGDGPVAEPPPNIVGLLEVRNAGLIALPVTAAPVALILRLDPHAPRLPDPILHRDILGSAIPLLPFRAGDAVQALRAEHALRLHGLRG